MVDSGLSRNHLDVLGVPTPRPSLSLIFPLLRVSDHERHETEATWHATADIATDNSSFLPWVVVLEQNRRLSLARHGANVMSIINPLRTKNFSYKDAIETLNLLYIICELKFKKIMHKRNLINNILTIFKI